MFTALSPRVVSPFSRGLEPKASSTTGNRGHPRVSAVCMFFFRGLFGPRPEGTTPNFAERKDKPIRARNLDGCNYSIYRQHVYAFFVGPKLRAFAHALTNSPGDGMASMPVNRRWAVGVFSWDRSHVSSYVAFPAVLPPR